MGVNISGEPTVPFEGECLRIVSAWSSGQMSFEEATATLVAMSEKAAQANEIASRAYAEYTLGYIYHYRGHLDLSIGHYARARKLFMHVQNLKRVASIELHQGQNYHYKGETDHAIQCYRSAFSIARQYVIPEVQVVAVLKEGLLLVELGQLITARRILETAYELTQQWDEEQADADLLDGILCEIYSGLASIDLAQNHCDDAWAYALLTLEIATRNPLPKHVGFANRVIAMVIGQMDSAPAPGFEAAPGLYFEVALSAFREINAEAEVAHTLFAYARYYARRDERHQAIQLYQKVAKTFTRLGMVAAAARAAEAQYNFL